MISDIKISFEETNRLDIAGKKKLHAPEKQQKVVKTEAHREKENENNINSTSVTCGATSNCLLNTRAISVPERNKE